MGRHPRYGAWLARGAPALRARFAGHFAPPLQWVWVEAGAGAARGARGAGPGVAAGEWQFRLVRPGPRALEAIGAAVTQAAAAAAAAGEFFHSI